MPRIPQWSNFYVDLIDDNGKPIEGAFVRLSRDDGAGTVLITDRLGHGQTWLAGGSYEVTVSKRGFRTERGVITTEFASNGQPAHLAQLEWVMERHLMSDEDDNFACPGLLDPGQTATVYVACSWPPTTAK